MAWAWISWGRRPESASTDTAADASLVAIAVEASREDVVRTCGACHAYPPPEVFPRDDWPREVARGFEFRGKSPRSDTAPPIASVIAYYQAHAPEAFPVLEQSGPTSPFALTYRSVDYRPDPSPGAPGISNVRFVHLGDDRRLDVLACDMIHGRVMLLKPYEPSPSLRIVSEVIPNPAHAEVVDLDRDGIGDILVANLGSPVPSERRLGSVVWLRGRADGTFTPITLIDNLGRVADAQAADFDGDGDLDLVVAEFGRLTLGSILLVENRTTDYDRPVFVGSTVDPRHGAIHVPVADLDGDGRPDFVAMISQEHETVVAFLNAGGGRFVAKTVFDAPHPAFGSSGIQLVDLDRDGDLDVLWTNGDSLDSNLLRPYHGVQWLENRGTYPFEYHRLTSLYGVHRAVAADLDRDGDLDIVATTFLPGSFYEPLCREKALDSIVVLEQTSPGQFRRSSLEVGSCDHASCDVGDFDGDGTLDLLIGNFFMPDPDGPGGHRSAPWITIRKGLGMAR